ncbi:MAG: regulatory protein RecX [Clostridia bacterium]|nr:regulatory protein RecX [Clostridia bacterium]
MKKKKTGKSALDCAFDYLAAKARTVREVEDKLDSLDYGDYEVYAAVERLKELGYLNDEKYATDFVNSRLATKPVSRRKLREQLYSHHINREDIDIAMSLVTDDIERKNAAEVAEKYYRQFDGLEEDERKKRTMRRLMGRGYDFALVRDSVEAVIGQVECVEDYEEDDEE